MRGRAWRRHIEQVFILKRIKNSSNWYYWTFINNNYSRTPHPTIVDFIGTKNYFNSKTISTDKYSTRRKDKFSPNRGKKNWGRPGSTPNTREWNKKYFIKILKENGIV